MTETRIQERFTELCAESRNLGRLGQSVRNVGGVTFEINQTNSAIHITCATCRAAGGSDFQVRLTGNRQWADHAHQAWHAMWHELNS